MLNRSGFWELTGRWYCKVQLRYAIIRFVPVLDPLECSRELIEPQTRVLQQLSSLGHRSHRLAIPSVSCIGDIDSPSQQPQDLITQHIFLDLVFAPVDVPHVGAQQQRALVDQRDNNFMSDVDPEVGPVDPNRASVDAVRCDEHHGAEEVAPVLAALSGDHLEAAEQQGRSQSVILRPTTA